MTKIYTILLIIIPTLILGQSTESNTSGNDSGLFFGLGIGAGVLTLNTNDTLTSSFSSTLPNIKIGYKFNDRFKLLALLPGANYKYKGKDRGFEGILIAAQFNCSQKLWLSAGTGLTFDAPAFYTVKDPKTAGFYTGFPAFTLATGYNFWKSRKINLDLQYRIFIGNSHLPNNGKRFGVSNMIIFGINWE